MDFKKLAGTAKGLVDKRGGTDALKEDADEVKGILRGEGSLTQKAKAAAAAIKDPGAPVSSSEKDAPTEAGPPDSAEKP